MNSINLLIVLVLTIGQTYGCGDFDSADRCMQQTIIIGNPHLHFPLNNKEMDSHCGSIAVSEKCIKDYSERCLDSLARHVTSVLVNNAVKTNKGYCTHQTRRQAFLKLGQCANSRKDALDQLMYSFIDTLQAIDSEAQNNMKIPMLCCNYNQFKTAIIEEARSDRQPVCPESAFVEIEHLVEGFASDVMKMICPLEYQGDSGDKCDSILSITPKITSTENRTKSMLMPLINIFNSLKN